MNSETPVILNAARTKASARSARASRTATTSGYDTPTFSHVGEHPPFPVGTLVRLPTLQFNRFLRSNGSLLYSALILETGMT
jgi:hypothetical protein